VTLAEAQTTLVDAACSASRVAPPQAEEHAMDSPEISRDGAKDAPPARHLHDGAGNQSLAALSNELVRIYKDQFGRGPTKVRSNYAGPDTIVCLLENTFTPAEKSLQGMGEHQRLREMRMFFQYASAGDFTAAVTGTTGRRVRSFISGIDTNTDIACELFVLEPQSSSEAVDGVQDVR
jgi:uncharacterized protein YbcI